jgi:hypothetical protein
MIIDLPDYTGGVRGHGPYGFSDIAPAINHELLGLRAGLNASMTAGLASPTGSQATWGTGFNPYPVLVDERPGHGLDRRRDVLGNLAHRAAIEYLGTPAEPSDQPPGGRAGRCLRRYIGDYLTRGLPGQSMNSAAHTASYKPGGSIFMPGLG